MSKNDCSQKTPDFKAHEKWLFEELKKNPQANFPIEEMLHNRFFTNDDQAGEIVSRFLTMGIIVKNNAYYRLTNKALQISDFDEYQKNDKIKSEEALLVAKKTAFDWHNRVIAHPLVTGVLGTVIGSIAGYFLGHFTCW